MLLAGCPSFGNFSETSVSTFGGFRGSSRSPTPAPCKCPGFSYNSNRLSLSLPRDSSHPSLALSRQSVTSNNPNRPDLRLFPKVSSARSRPLKRLSPNLIFGSFRRFHWVTPPLPENFVPFRHCFGKASRARENFGFFRRCFGFFWLQEQKREGVQIRGGSESYRRGGGSHSWHLTLGEGDGRMADLVEGQTRCAEQ